MSKKSKRKKRTRIRTMSINVGQHGRQTYTHTYIRTQDTTREIGKKEEARKKTKRSRVYCSTTTRKEDQRDERTTREMM